MYFAMVSDCIASGIIISVISKYYSQINGNLINAQRAAITNQLIPMASAQPT